VLDQRGLRPTTDRVRETLFNWLAPVIAGSRCLDCFAGSGALGFEALSRGAASVLLIERAAPVAEQLRRNAATLSAAGPDGTIEVVRADALDWLARHSGGSVGHAPVDVVFLDPPFDSPVLPQALQLLRGGLLHAESRIYIETPATVPAPALPEDWSLLRERTAGQVRYALVLSGPEATD
jgi:16S rRNA (guanine966-N2)-methyltransferase